MSDLIKAFTSVLKVTIPTAAVRPALGKEYTLPAAIYSVRNGMRDLFYRDSFGLRRTEFTVTIYSKSYSELQTLKSSVVAKFHGFSGLLDSVEVDKAIITTVLDGYDDDDLETVYRSTILINISD